MAQQVWKHQLNITDSPQTVCYPKPFEVAHVGMQNGEPTIWFTAEPGIPWDVYRTFIVRGTGHDLPQGASYIGTAFEQGQSIFVWHVFELIEYKPFSQLEE